MKAVVWHATKDVRVEEAPDPKIEQPTDAVGMEAHGNPGAGMAQKLAGLLPDSAARKLMQTAGVDRLQALTQAVETVCRGGTISVKVVLQP